MGQDCDFCGENLDDFGMDHVDGTLCDNCSTMNYSDDDYCDVDDFDYSDEN